MFPSVSERVRLSVGMGIQVVVGHRVVVMGLILPFDDNSGIPL